MVYLIGGGARCGKTSLAKKLLSLKPGCSYLSGDSFRQSLKPVLPSFHTSGVNSSDPEVYIRYYNEHTKKAIDETIKRAEVLWPFIERYIISYCKESNDDLIVESVDVWPQLIQKLEIAHKAIFIVDSNVTQWKRVTSHLGKNDWITAKQLNSEQIEAWASYNAPRSKRIIEMSSHYGYEYKDIAEIGFEAAQDEALISLKGK
jgi:2-phosphoglycerate kinase